MDSNEKWIREQEAPRDLLPGVSGHLQRKQYEPQYCMDSREGKASYAAQDVRNLSRLEVVKGTLMMIEYVTLDDWHSSFAVFFDKVLKMLLVWLTSAWFTFQLPLLRVISFNVGVTYVDTRKCLVSKEQDALKQRGHSELTWVVRDWRQK